MQWMRQLKWGVRPGGWIATALVLLTVRGDAAGLAGPGPGRAAAPAPVSTALPGRLARWSFDSGVQGDRGQAPTVQRAQLAPGFQGTGAAFPRTGLSMLCYRDVERDGRPNFNSSNGTVRFWFKPNWSSASNGVPGGPRTNGRFIELGGYGFPGGQWSLYTDPDGSLLGFVTAATVNGKLEHQYAFDGATLVRPGFQSNRWYQVVLVYSPAAVSLFLNGELRSTGPGLRLGPDAAARARGVFIGNDASGNQSVDGVIDELEFFDRPLAAREVAQSYREQRMALSGARSAANAGRETIRSARSFRDTVLDGRTTRLAYWRFDGDAVGEQGQEPLLTRQLAFVPGWSGQALDMSRERGAQLQVRLAERDGSANLFAEHGTVRFWFRPRWSSGSRGPSEATLMAVADSRGRRTLWSLVVDAARSRLIVRDPTGAEAITAPARFQARQWCQLAVTYDTNRSLLFFNGEFQGSGRGAGVLAASAANAPQVDSLLIGTSLAGDSPADGEFDELELFGEPLDVSRQLAGFVAVQEVDSDRNGVVDLAEELSFEAPSPFSSVPRVVVGVLPAELFDQGGEGVAYHSGRDHGTRRFRRTRLAIEPSDDRGGGWCVGQLAAGDWMIHTFEVRHAGAYSVVLRAAPQRQPGGAWDLEISRPRGPRLTSPELRMTQPGWADLAWTNVSLAPGVHRLRVRAARNGPDGTTGRLNDIAIIPWMPAADAAVPARRVVVDGLVADAATPVVAEANTRALARAVARLGRGTGGRVVFPAGTYYVASPSATRRNEAQGFGGRSQAAMLVEGVEDVEIAGAPGGATTLVAFDRTTTVLLLQNCRRVTVRDIVFKGRPFRRPDGGLERLPLFQTCRDCQFSYGAGSLTMAAYTRDLLVQRCGFINAPVDGMILDAVTNATFTANEFVFFNGEPVDGVVARFENAVEAAKGHGGGVGVFSSASPCMGVVVTGNRYNGHPNLDAAASDTPTGDGIVWFSNGANFHVADNQLVNYGLEGVAFNSGPAAVVRNRFATVKRYPATTPLMFVPTGWSNRIWAYRPEDQSFCFVGNEVEGGPHFVYTSSAVSKRFPYDLLAADNRGRLVEPRHLGRQDGMSSAFELPDADRVCLSGNQLIAGSVGVNLYGALRLAECLGNDFSAAERRSVRFDIQGSGLRWAVLLGNDLGAGAGAHLELPWPLAGRFFLRDNDLRQPNGNPGKVLFTIPPDAPVHRQGMAGR